MSNLPSRLPAAIACLMALSGCGGGSRPAAETAPAPATVSASTIEQVPSESVEKILEGRVAGVTVSRAQDGGIAVRIRGSTSFYGNNEPLYILDGVPFEPGPSGSLTGISPYDIESIKVLKDAADVAIYGARGANGVIVVKTKRSKRQ